MFKFNFDIEEDGDLDPSNSELFQLEGTAASTYSTQETTSVEDSSEEISVEELVSSLPTAISFSPLSIPTTSNQTVVLSRRDLFDARFQLISSEDAQNAENPASGHSDIDFLDAPSDLVPGVYEGGLKTWECSLDLVDCLSTIYGPDIGTELRRRRVLELGCGTAVPSLYLLHQIFSSGPPASQESHIDVHLQDYNEMVLRLVTLPNVILAWYMSPAAEEFRASLASTQPSTTDEDGPDTDLPPADPTQPGELPLTPALISAFLSCLHTYGLHLKFFSGSWASFDVAGAGGPYDLILTSETIYRPASLPSLVNLLRRATRPSTREPDALSDATAQLTLEQSTTASLDKLAKERSLCLVAAKLVYFGVGGGVNEFVRAVTEGSESKGRVETIWETSRGVRRSIMRVIWDTK